ncbi:MAG TPA: hypothetical protein PLO07_02765, partial [Rubrivivax sp.]|nr:hypothetical protein [Rubrivivax sp.]
MAALRGDGPGTRLHLGGPAEARLEPAGHGRVKRSRRGRLGGHAAIVASAAAARTAPRDFGRRRSRAAAAPDRPIIEYYAPWTNGEMLRNILRMKPRALILHLLLGAQARADAALGVRELLGAGALFGHAPNSMRVALARAVSAGWLVAPRRGAYALGPMA